MKSTFRLFCGKYQTIFFTVLLGRNYYSNSSYKLLYADRFSFIEITFFNSSITLFINILPDQTFSNMLLSFDRVIVENNYSF